MGPNHPDRETTKQLIDPDRVPVNPVGQLQNRVEQNAGQKLLLAEVGLIVIAVVSSLPEVPNEMKFGGLLFFMITVYKLHGSLIRHASGAIEYANLDGYQEAIRLIELAEAIESFTQDFEIEDPDTTPKLVKKTPTV
jgi:hypothetical protein